MKTKKGLEQEDWFNFVKGIIIALILLALPLTSFSVLGHRVFVDVSKDLHNIMKFL
jgi:hypothetical protein